MATTTAAPSAAARAISDHRSARLTGSTPVVGSSSTSSAGLVSMAAITPSFCRIPPDSRPASRSRAAVSPARARNAALRSAAAAAGSW